MDATKLLGKNRIVPVVVLDSADAAVPLAKALLDAGINLIEVTLRTDDALQGMRQIASEVPEMMLGVGSVRRPQQFLAAMDAGAKFAVGPGSSDRLTDAARDHQLPFIPGATTPSETIALLEKGYSLQKFFPAEICGGHAYLKALAGPLPEVSFMPTGGIRVSNAADYFALGNVACIGGTWIAPPALQRAGDFAAIGKLATDALQLAV